MGVGFCMSQIQLQKSSQATSREFDFAIMLSQMATILVYQPITKALVGGKGPNNFVQETIILFRKPNFVCKRCFAREHANAGKC